MSTAATLPADRRLRPGLLAVSFAVVMVHVAFLGGAGALSRTAPATVLNSGVVLQVRTVNAPSPRPGLHSLAPAAAPRATPHPGPAQQPSPTAVERSRDTAASSKPERTPTPPQQPMGATAEGGSAPSGASLSASSPVPVYRTRMPPSGQWRYAFRRAGREGEALLQWRHDGQRYEAQLDGSAAGDPGSASLQWRSSGVIDEAGIAPQRFVDRRDRRRAAANFDRDSGRIGYSATPEEQVLWPGGQDRLSVLLQLPAILDGRRTPAAMGEELLLQVTGARGDAQLWRFEVQGPERVTLPDGSQRFALKLLREPSHAWDTRVEIWTDPQARHLPLRVVMRNGAHVLELLLQGAADNDERER